MVGTAVAVGRGRGVGARLGRRRRGCGVRVARGLGVAEGARSAPALGGSAESPIRWVESELAA